MVLRTRVAAHNHLSIVGLLETTIVMLCYLFQNKDYPGNTMLNASWLCNRQTPTNMPL